MSELEDDVIRRQTMQEAIETLTFRQWQVVTLKAAGFNQREIAAKLGMSQPAVYYNLALAEKKLKDCLK